MLAPLAATSWILFAGLAQAPSNTRAAAAEAASYLNAALDQLEQNSRVYTTDWKALRAQAQAAIAAAGAQTSADTYPAIRAALATLGDKHALLLDPAAAKLFNLARATKGTGLLVAPDARIARVLPGSPAEAAGLALGDRIVTVAGLSGFAELPRREFDRLFKSGQRPDGSAAPLELSVRSGEGEPRAVTLPLGSFDEYLEPSGRRLAGGVGYLELPGVATGSKPTTYDDILHDLLAQFDDGSWSGCIVDLRRNTGGTLWPMLAGIGPLAGAGKLGAFTSGQGGADWSYDAELGRATSETYELAKVDEPFPLCDDLPVAVLTGPLTAQAGEALALAFAGRARTRRFGEGTRGLPTSNTQKVLSDGALLLVTVTVHADRTGKRYDHVIAPDETIATDWTRFGTDDDPVIAAACRWLATAHDAK